MLSLMKWNSLWRAKEACKNSEVNEFHHFANVGKMIKMPKGGTKQVNNYNLSRYACYLIVQNSDPRKEVIALGQTYFAMQTRKRELSEEEYSKLSEDDKRFYNRSITKRENNARRITHF